MSQLYEITGCISRIKPVQTFPSGFQKCEVVINDKDPKYPQEIAVQFIRDGVKNISEYNEGDHVCVTFAIQGREYNGKHYVDLKAIKVERAKKLGGESYVGVDKAAGPSWSQTVPMPSPTTGGHSDSSQQKFPADPIGPNNHQYDNDLPF